MNYQWYPGHMTKAVRMMQENIKLIDLVIELVDARTPMSSKNPDIDSLAGNKARVILLNKADLADPAGNAAWTEYFKKKGFHVLEINARTGAGVRAVQGLVQEACKAYQGYGGRYSQCGEINLYQCFCRKGVYQNR